MRVEGGIAYKSVKGGGGGEKGLVRSKSIHPKRKDKRGGEKIRKTRKWNIETGSIQRRKSHQKSLCVYRTGSSLDSPPTSTPLLCCCPQIRKRRWIFRYFLFSNYINSHESREPNPHLKKKKKKKKERWNSSSFPPPLSYFMGWKKTKKTSV